VITKRGKQTEIYLPDGTHVWLNSESSLKYPNKLFKNKVDVFLEGEAYFDVTKLKGRDFTVNVGEIEITVQGTSFNVKAYKNEKTIETTLDEGKITVTNKNKSKQEFKPVIMRPNQHLVINSSDNIYKLFNLSYNKAPTDTQNPVQTRNIDIKKGTTIFTAWKDGVLIFKNKRFEDLEKELERWYDVQIIIRDSVLKEARYTGIFEKESLETALKALSLSLPFKYTITPDSVIIKPNNEIIITRKTDMPMK
jgi:ferric-dicitrate binding protein FerR (iron transport regulator)